MLKRIPKKRTNASRSQIVKNVRTGETAIYTPDVRQPRIPAGWVPLNSARRARLDPISSDYSDVRDAVLAGDDYAVQDVFDADVADTAEIMMEDYGDFDASDSRLFDIWKKCVRKHEDIYDMIEDFHDRVWELYS